jgi:hypothetical protein
MIKLQQALADGFAVVIGLQSTGEASLNWSGSGQGFVSVLQSTLLRMIENHFVTDGTFREDQKKEKLIEDVHAIQNWPPAPLDYLIDELGGKRMVAEMTGRSVRVVRNDRGELQTEPRHGGSKLNIKERSKFQNGSKHIAIISEAASTGVSLHADKRLKSAGKRRFHLTIELPWSADKAVQQFGRSHRSNQESSPFYCLLSSPDIAGERRLTSVIANRLNELGATLHGDRNATAGGCDLSSFDLNRNLSAKAINTFLIPDMLSKRQGYTKDNAFTLSFIDEAFTMQEFCEKACTIAFPISM